MKRNHYAAIGQLCRAGIFFTASVIPIAPIAVMLWPHVNGTDFAYVAVAMLISAIAGGAGYCASGRGKQFSLGLLIWMIVANCAAVALVTVAAVHQIATLVPAPQ